MTKKELIELLEQFEDNAKINFKDMEGVEHFVDSVDNIRDRYSGEWTIVVKITNN